MKGFDTKALLLFPKMENYENRSVMYKYQFKRAVSNFVKYLLSCGIEPHVFYTDDVARELNDESFVWVNPLGESDSFFISRHCEGTSDAMKDMITYPELTNAVLAKDPGSLDMSESDRFEMVLRHVTKTTAKIIPTYRIVVNFTVPNRSQYKVASKPGDSKIRVTVSANNFVPQVLMSGNKEDPCDIFNVPYGNRSLDNWEV